MPAGEPLPFVFFFFSNEAHVIAQIFEKKKLKSYDACISFLMAPSDFQSMNGIFLNTELPFV